MRVAPSPLYIHSALLRPPRICRPPAAEGQRVVYNSLQWKKIQNGSWCPFFLTASVHWNKSPRLQRLALVSFTVAVKWLRFFFLENEWKSLNFIDLFQKLSEQNATLVFLMNGNKSLSRGVFRLWAGKQIPLVYLEQNLGLKVRSGDPARVKAKHSKKHSYRSEVLGNEPVMSASYQGAFWGLWLIYTPISSTRSP